MALKAAAIAQQNCVTLGCSPNVRKAFCIWEVIMNETKAIVFCHKATMKGTGQGVSAATDETSADEGVILEPLRQEKHADGSQDPKAEGKKLTQYMAAVFGRFQCVRECTCLWRLRCTMGVHVLPCLFRAVVNRLSDSRNPLQTTSQATTHTYI
jgi:hypothetical protein